jgi:hypothetical protein
MEIVKKNIFYCLIIFYLSDIIHTVFFA